MTEEQERVETIYWEAFCTARLSDIGIGEAWEASQAKASICKSRFSAPTRQLVAGLATPTKGRAMTDKEAIADTQLIHDALRFLFWAAGQGISPTNTDDAPEPEEALCRFTLRTGDEHWETMADRWLVSVTPRSTQAPIP